MNMNISGVHIGLTDNCNFKCDYCFSGRQRSASMNLAAGKKVIDLLASQARGPVRITYFGGEPLLLFPLLKQMTSYALRRQTKAVTFTFEVVTNGSLLSKEILSFFKKHRFAVLFSFDGIEEAQDAHRILHNGGSTYSKALDNLKLLIESGLSLAVRPTVTPRNTSCLAQSVAFLFDLGVKHIAFDLAYESPWTKQHIRILKDQMSKVADLYLKKIMPDREDILIYPFHEAIVSKMTGDPHPRCGGGKDSFYVSPDGDFLFCCWFRGRDEKEVIARIGNLREGFDTGKLDALNRAVNDAAKNRFGCPECDYQKMCNKYCIAHNYLCTGNLFEVAPVVCAYEKIRIAAALKIGKKLFDNRHPYVLNIIRNSLFT